MNKYLLSLLLVASCVPGPQYPQRREPIDRPRGSVDVPVMVAQEFATSSIAKPHCGEDMVLIDGMYCPQVREECDKWLDPSGTKFARCKTYKPSVCVSKERVHTRFCMDVDEYTEKGDTLPKSNVSWADAKSTCEQNNKRLCKETEFNYACEAGPNGEIHAHTTGLERPSSVCNFDLGNLLNAEGKLNDYRKVSSSLTGCVNSFTGVRNLNGNVDEWTMRDATFGPYKSALKGGWWMAARERCRPATVDHSETNYWSVSAGFRCCSDAN